MSSFQLKPTNTFNIHWLLVKASYSNVVWSDKPLLRIIILIIRLLGGGRKYILMDNGPWDTATVALEPLRKGPWLLHADYTVPNRSYLTPNKSLGWVGQGWQEKLMVWPACNTMVNFIIIVHAAFWELNKCINVLRALTSFPKIIFFSIKTAP